MVHVVVSTCVVDWIAYYGQERKGDSLLVVSKCISKDEHIVSKRNLRQIQCHLGFMTFHVYLQQQM